MEYKHVGGHGVLYMINGNSYYIGVGGLNSDRIGCDTQRHSRKFHKI